MRLSLALVGLAMAVLVLFVPGSGAILTGSTFEGNDGNMIHTGSNTDWDNVRGGALTLTDAPSGSTDNIFVQGTKENDTNVSIDTSHAAPSKDDILRAYVASETAGASTFLYLSWIREANNGDAHIDFELNQNATSGWTASSTSATIPRSPGDLLISYDFSGSGTPTITSFTWNGSAWVNQTNLSTLGFAEAGVNTGGPITDSISGGSIDTAQFGEASINLSDIPGTNFTPNTCESFGSVLVKTRSSGSGGTAELKDFILPAPIHVSNCGSITIHKTVPGSETASQTFSYTASGADASVAGFNLTVNGVAGADTKSYPAVQPGAYSFDETPVPAGWKFNSLTCTSSGAGTSTSQSGSALSVTLGASGIVDCTYNNIPKTGTIEVKKILSPATNNGLFDLTIGSTVFNNNGAGYGNGGTTAAQTLKLGTYAISEAGHTGTSLSRYTSTYACTKNGSALTSGTGTSVPNGVSLAADGDAIVCTFTNTFTKIAATIATTVKDGSNNTVDNANHASLGTAVHDTSTLGGAVTGFPMGDGTTGAPNGATVTYEFFNGTTCPTGAHTDQTVTVAADGTVPNADPKTLGAGSYSYLAVYSGNQYYNGKTGDCEPFVINQSSSTVVTTVKDGQGVTVDNANPASLGTTTHDTAVLGGAINGFALGDGTTSAPNGATVTYQLFTGAGSCPSSTTHVDQTVTVNADGTVPNSAGLVLARGSYAYRAVYSGNANYAGQTGACEPFTVNQAPSTVVTTVKDGSNVTVDTQNPAALGTATHDTAVLGGALNGFPLGDGTTNAPNGATVTYQFFNQTTCPTGAHTDETVTVNANGTVPGSTPKTLGAGLYAYRAVYSGNGNYAGQTGACEPFTVNVAPSTVVTTVKNAAGGTVDNANPAALGTATHDTAVLGGAVNGFPLGDGTTGAPNGATVTYQFFNQTSCPSGAHTDQTVTVAADGTVPGSSAQTLGAGLYAYRAVYSGNANYGAKTGDCEPFTITKAPSTVVTTVKDGANGTVDTQNPAALGTATHDTAVLGGAVNGYPLGGASDPATVTYEFFNQTTCPTGAHTDQTVAVAADGTVPGSTPQTLAAGSYAYLAVYSGNGNYAGKTGACEPFTITKAPSTVVTTVKDGANVTVDNANPGLLGVVTHDTAVLGGTVGSFPLGGASDPATVTYEFFNGTTCPTGVHTDESVAVAADGSVPASTPKTLGAGSYSYLAVYSGNSNYGAKTGACEPFTISPKQLTVTTQVHDAGHVDVTSKTVQLGATVHDLSVVTGAVNGFTPTGAVTFVLYSGSNCDGLSQVVAADGNESGNVRSVDVLSLVPGNYGFKATVAGDGNYLGQTGACEPFSVGLAQTTTVTAIHDANHSVVTTVALGTTVHDAAMVTSANSTAKPTGNVNFTFFPNSTCTGQISTSAGSHALDPNGVADPSSSEGPLAAGSYGFKATYVGDTNFAGSTGECEPLTVGKGTPTVDTTLHNAAGDGIVANATHLPLHSGLYDVASLSNGTGFPFTGTVTFEFFTNSTCGGTPASAQTGVSITGSTAQSSTHSSLGAGSYSFDARYVAGSDTNHNDSLISSCEPFFVDQAPSTVVTTVKNGDNGTVDTQNPAPLGTATHDTALLGGTVGNFPLGDGTTNAPNGATVTYQFFNKTACPSGEHTDEVVTVAADGTVPGSTPQTLGAGSYAYRAVYSGNGNYAGQTGACEPFTVSQAPSTVVTTVKDGGGVTVDTQNPGALGTVTHDTAVLGGAVNGFSLDAGAIVTYEFFNQTSCPAGPHTDEAVTVASDGTVPGSTPKTLSAGSYAYRAVYSGNTNYAPQTGECEPFTISPKQLVMNTQVHDATHADVTSTAVALGTTVHDLSVVTGAVNGFVPNGAVTFALYTGTGCDSTAVVVGANGNESGNVRSADVPLLPPGNYGFKASVAGDSNYLGTTGACEEFSVAKATTTTVTAIHDADHGVVTTVVLGTTVHDAATVTSANSTAKPTGNVNFTFFPNSTCTGESSTSAGSHVLDSNGLADPSSSEGPLAAGSYGFRASYVGDSNFAGSTGDCEPLTVSKGTPTTATTLHNASGNGVVENGTHLPLGSGLYDVATLSNGSGFPFTGTVTFEFFTNSNCTGEPTQQTGVSIDGSTAQSSTHSSLNAGNYAFDARYVAGNDPNHNDSVISGCEPFTIDKAAPTIATTLSASEVVIGTTVHDSAKLTGAGSNATGSVTYTVFDNNTCTSNANTRDAGTVSVTNGNVADSNALLFNTAGDFYWQAVYGGDANNLAATSPCTSEHLVVEKPGIAITKTPATQAVNSGGTATFTITVTNTGTVTLTNVTVTDPLSLNCAKSIGTLTPGQVSTYTCTQGNVTAAFTNVATVTGHPPVGPDVTASASANVTVNSPPPPSSPPSTPTPPTVVDLAIVKTVDQASVVRGSNVTYTLTVTNNGPVTDTAVQVADSLPFGVTYVSSTASQGTCSGTAVVQCTIGTMTNGQKVTITIVVNTTNTGTIANTGTVVGALPETTLTNNTSSVSINVTAPPAPKPAPKPVFKPPVVKPAPKRVPPPCYAVVAAPKSLTVGKAAILRLQVTAKNKALPGVKVEVKGAGILKLSNRTDKSGRVTMLLHPKKPGIVLVKPASYKGCTNPRIGVIGAFTPPVTG